MWDLEREALVIIRTAPGLGEDDDAVWFVSFPESMQWCRPVREKNLRPLEESDVIRLMDGSV